MRTVPRVLSWYSSLWHWFGQLFGGFDNEEKPMTNMRPQLSSAELERLLESEGYLWNGWIRGYERVRDVRRETAEEYLARRPALVTLEELEDNGCTKAEATPQERTAGYAWLKRRLSRTRLRQLSHRPR
jgi:hypothetical protein